ncbi:Golgi-specific brefeldin A-resistance guanine nucleotide exchange factor 1-like isoform X2 [Agrilus planipennis]|uniref:Golgi-specific brefeldin A-resistance guanine nucleotide exchange factor 1-like isoform X2 n=1 Tax=Agrilus planipennis TaxID=224129 RepID=A0A7F5RMF0_AGRPL|nr:Golgi-specific brefeldin A-resistance guanine nucleotide exchange factor 1-like isoform X2 [Agrilus planipennis]
MVLPGNGIFIVRGELSVLMTAMKRGVRWSSHSYQEGEMDNLVKSLQDLKVLLNKLEDLKTVDPVVFVNPFLDVIRSEDTSGPVTSLALMAINKIISYGILDSTHHNIALVVDNIADAVTHAKFVGTDQSSDGVVLMKIIQVLRTLTLSTEGVSLTNDSLCEIMLACFRICFETRLSELLRRTAELYLKDMVQLVFMRLPEFPEDLKPSNIKHLKMKAGVMESSRTKRKNKTKKISNTSAPTVDKNNLVNFTYTTKVDDNTNKNNIVDMQGSISQDDKIKEIEKETKGCEEMPNKEEERSASNLEVETIGVTNEEVEVNSSSVTLDTNLNQVNSIVIPTEQIQEKQDEEYVNYRGIRFTPQQEESFVLLPYGLACIREMFRFLISLCNPLDKQNTDTMIHLGLSLLTVAFEVGADNIGKYESLLVLVKNNLCRNLISLLHTERISIFAVNLQVSFLMFESLRIHLKFQLELYLTKLIEMITSDAIKVTYEHRELALDYIVQLWRIPGFVTELYVNYDCSMYCSNLFEDLTKLLAKNAFPTVSGVYHTHLLSLDTLLTVIENIENHCIEATKLKFERNNCLNHNEEVETLPSDILEITTSRQKISKNVPTKEELMAVKNIKKVNSFDYHIH